MKQHTWVIGIALFLMIIAIGITWGWFRFFTAVEQHVRGNTPEYSEYADSMMGRMFESNTQFANSSPFGRDLLGSFGSVPRDLFPSSFRIQEVLGLNKVYISGTTQMNLSFELVDAVNKSAIGEEALVNILIEDQKHLKIFSQAGALYDGVNQVWKSTLIQTLPEGRYRLVIQVSCLSDNIQCTERYGEDMYMEFVEFSVK